MAVVRIDTLRTKANGAITNSYTTVGSALTRNWRMFRITNNTDGDMLFSVDGTNNNLFVPSYSFILYDLATNALNVQDSDWFVMQIGTQFYVKYSTAPTTGDVWIEGIYSTGV
jgi:hypothetical protein